MDTDYSKLLTEARDACERLAKALREVADKDRIRDDRNEWRQMTIEAMGKVKELERLTKEQQNGQVHEAGLVHGVADDADSPC